MGEPLAFLSGTSIRRSRAFAGWSEEKVPTAYGTVELLRREGWVVLNRHGRDYLPPHAINHQANIAALAALGVRTVLSLNSVGSLQEDLPPGTVLSCGDYVSFRPLTFDERPLRSLGPVVPNDRIPEVAAAWGEPLPRDRVYVQTPGPRFETRAEVRILRSWGDVVGMTMASEADLAQEAGLSYNSLCIVDNWANGVRGESLSAEAFADLVRRNQERVDRLIACLLTLSA